MKKIIVSILVIGCFFSVSIVSVNAFDVEEFEGELENSGPSVIIPWGDEVWDVETVDSNGNVGRGTSLAMDSNGYPHICYWDRDNYYLKYVRFNGLEWEDPQIIDTHVLTVYHSLALDSNNRPHIAYADFIYGNILCLKYIRWTGLEWEEHIVDTDGNVGREVSLVLDEYDNPHMSYTELCIVDDFAVYYPKYAYRDDTTWQVEYVEETSDCDIKCSIDLDSENIPHILYTEQIRHPSYPWYIGGILKYATRTNDGWIKESITEARSLGDLSFALDSNDNPHICYVVIRAEDPEFENQPYDNDLYYAHRINNNFGITIIDDSFSSTNLLDPCLTIDSNDNPHICYRHTCWSDPNQSELKYATIKEGLWRIELVGSENRHSFGRYCSIAIDGENTPHISYYYDYYEGGLMYAKKIRDEKPPNKPTIDGPVNVKVNDEQEYTFVSSDPDGQNLYYYIEWGDYSIEEWIGPYSSGEEVIVSHIWEEEGEYTIEAKVRDIYGVESNMETLDVTLSKNCQGNYENNQQNLNQQYQSQSTLSTQQYESQSIPLSTLLSNPLILVGLNNN